MSTISCSRCGERFLDKGRKDYHQRNCKSAAVLIFPNGKVTLQQDANGHFLCQCTHPQCPKPFTKIDSLKKHMKRANSTWKPLLEHVSMNNFCIS
jgi:hypothetical protein